jgi:hypothetical protein
LPHKNILMIEGGPSDVGDDRALILKDRFKMQGTELDYAYTSVPQPNGMYAGSRYVLVCARLIVSREQQYPTFAGKNLGWLF